MASVDIVILLIIGTSCLIGVFRGLIKEALSLVFWVVAIVAGSLLSGKVGSLLSGTITSPMLQKIVAFVLIFILTVFVGGLISTGISRLMSKAGLSAADHSLGALFGIIRGLVVVTIIVMLTSRFGFTQKYYNNSLVVPHIKVVADLLEKLLDMAPPGNEKVRDAVKSN